MSGDDDVAEVTAVTELELTLDEGREARAARFFRAGNDLLALVDELSDQPVDWLITELRLGSAVVRLSSPASMPEAAEYLRRPTRGLQLVRDGQPAPSDWSPDALKAARQLVTDEDTERQPKPSRLTLIDGDRGGDAVELTEQLGVHLAALQPAERSMRGAVRGHVVGVNIARGNRASLKAPTGNVIKVSFPDELRVPLRDALYSDVELAGQVRQVADGRVFHIRAEELRVLATPQISWAELFGLDPDITGGLSVADYLETSRGQA